MEYFENELKDSGFYRVHKGYIINFAYVSKIDTTDVKMNNGEIVPISRNKVIEARKEFLKYYREL